MTCTRPRSCAPSGTSTSDALRLQRSFLYFRLHNGTFFGRHDGLSSNSAHLSFILRLHITHAMDTTSHAALRGKVSTLAGVPVPLRKIRAVTLVRKSDWQHESLEHWHLHLQPVAEGLLEVWKHHYHAPQHALSHCNCVIEHRQITLVGVSSNENLATFRNHQVQALRDALQVDHEVCLLTSNHDGAFTNIHGYLQFLRGLNTTCIYSHMIWWSDTEHRIYDRHQLVDVFEQNQKPNSDRLPEIEALFGVATKVALNKTIISLALAQNRQIMGAQRNIKIPVPNFTSVQTPSIKRKQDPVKLPWDDTTKKQRKNDGHAQRRRVYFPLVDRDEGLECPCCQVVFADRESVIVHLVAKGRTSKQCPLCPATKEMESAKQPYWRKHIKGHIDEREQCGIDGCDFTPSNKNCMREHRASCHPITAKPKVGFPCDQCDLVLASLNSLGVHKKWHQNPHVNCNHCKALVPFRDLKGHKMRECPSLPDRIAVCTQCHHEMSPHHVARHMRTSHERVYEVMEFAREHYPDFLENYEQMIGMLQV
ncbi:hypothetical protein HBI23_131620 [Parastagonospora nodorum]|nr:hypothetical protein HBI47_031130 [Parastagonospora nodorum]KAH5660122.1 hypothetical protein HBI23_131620 [Parastagonospora nodorum]